VPDLVRSLSVVPDLGFGQRLRSARITRGLTQAQLGARLGVRQQTIGAWERGDKPQSRFLSPLAEFLGLDGLDELETMLDHLETSPAAGGPRTSRSDAGGSATSAEERLTVLTNAVSARLISGPPLTPDETATVRDLIAALRGGDPTR
jgi:transcriptional regulator with XRE-family HTH domain